MSFWLDDDDDPWSSEQQQQQQQLSQKQQQQPGASQQQQSNSNTNNGGTTSGVYVSHQEAQFRCDNCGGADSYHDDATGLDVCSCCFTQSQAPVSQPDNADWEDVVGLAARTAGGQIQQRRLRHSALQRKPGDTGRTKRPLQELDRSIPWPDAAVCLQGMQCVLQRCVRIAVTELLPKEPKVTTRASTSAPVAAAASKNNSDSDSDDSDDEDFAQGQRQDVDDSDELSLTRRRRHDRRKFAVVESAVKDLWTAYLGAWADGAEFYGTMHPHIRFSFRDCFLAKVHVSKLLRRHLVHQVVVVGNETATVEAVGGIRTENEDDTDGDGKPAASRKGERILDDSSSDEDEDEDDIKVAATDIDDLSVKKVIATKVNGLRGHRAYPNKIRSEAIREMLHAHTSYRLKGYREAALYIRPSMTMVAALIWLALTKHREASVSTAVVTSHDICHWISTGKLPLMSAFQNLLTRELQRRLAPVASFFRMEKPLFPAEVEAMATNLCVACRLRVRPKPVKDDDDDDSLAEAVVLKEEKEPESAVAKKGRRVEVRFWPVSSVPLILAQIVASVGLDQAVLDRALIMAGFSLDDPAKVERRKRRESSIQSAKDSLAIGSKTRKRRRKPEDEVEASPDPAKIPVVVQAEQLTRMDELLGLIAIACQLDPRWRTWTYCFPNEVTPAVPWNESQFRLLSNGPALNSYLDFIEQHVFPDDDVKNTDNRLSMLPQEYFEDVGSLANEGKSCISTTTAFGKNESGEEGNHVDAAVRPCSLIAGGQAPKDAEVTNLTKRRVPVVNIGEWHQQGRPQKPKKPKIYPRRNKNLDAMLLLPKQDFRQADLAASDWIPDNCPDADQDRLIQFLAFTTNADPEAVRRSMDKMLRGWKL